MSAARRLIDGLGLPESPRWHDGRIWFADHFQQHVSSTDLSGNVRRLAEFPERPSGLGFTSSGDPLVVLRDTKRVVRFDESGRSETLADLSPLGGDNLNDMTTDGRGRAYVDFRAVKSVLTDDPRPIDTGLDAIVLVRPDGSFEVAVHGLTTPNGIVISEDGSTLIVAETRAQRLTAFAIDRDTGLLSDRRIYAELNGARPDGIALDSDGAVWVASPNTGTFFRVHEGGAVDSTISVAPCFAIACALVGPQRSTLVMTVADTDWSRMAHRDSVGRIDLIEVPVSGAGYP